MAYNDNNNKRGIDNATISSAGPSIENRGRKKTKEKNNVLEYENLGSCRWFVTVSA